MNWQDEWIEPDDTSRPCPYCPTGEVIVDPDTCEGLCISCGARVTFDGPLDSLGSHDSIRRGGNA